jgi:hypothetical protein
MKTLRVLFLIGMTLILCAVPVFASGPDPMPWPKPPGGGVELMLSGPDPIPWPTPGSPNIPNRR